MPPETVWEVLGKEFRRISLHPDNLRYEAEEPALLRSGQVFEVVYQELVRFFTGRPDVHGNPWGRRVPGLKTWNPPIEMRER